MVISNPLSANHKIFGMDIFRRYVKNLLYTLFALCLQVVVICQIIGLGDCISHVIALVSLAIHAYSV